MSARRDIEQDDVYGPTLEAAWPWKTLEEANEALTKAHYEELAHQKFCSAGPLSRAAPKGKSTE